MTRGVPDQDLPENQDESVRYTVDEMTGRKTKLDEKGNPIEEPDEPETEEISEPEPKPKPVARNKRTSGPDAEKADAADAPTPGADTKESAAFKVREIGS